MALPVATTEPFYRMNEDGYMETVDPLTGQVIALSDLRNQVIEQTPVEYLPVEINGKSYLVQKGIPHSSLDKLHIAYSPALADIICQRLIEGKTFKAISLEPGMPSLTTISHWRKHNEDFDRKIKFARKGRAELMRDNVIELAELAKDSNKDYVPGIKAAMDAYRWAAEKDDAETYGNKVAVSGSIGVVQLMVETGIRRNSDEVKDVKADVPVDPVDDDRQEFGEGIVAIPGEVTSANDRVDTGDSQEELCVSSVHPGIVSGSEDDS